MQGGGGGQVRQTGLRVAVAGGSRGVAVGSLPVAAAMWRVERDGDRGGKEVAGWGLISGCHRGLDRAGVGGSFFSRAWLLI